MFEDLRKIFDEAYNQYRFWECELLKSNGNESRIILADYYGQMLGIARCAWIIYGVDSLMDIVDGLNNTDLDLFGGDKL